MPNAELLDLAAEIRRDCPELSIEQALDVAALELAALFDFADTYEEIVLTGIAHEWDRAVAAAGNKEALPR